MKDYFEKKRQEISVNLIKNWKSNESKLLREYGDRSAYFTKAMAKELWSDKKIRDEFNSDFSTLEAYLQNEHRASEHKGGLSRYTKKDAEAAADDASRADAGMKIKWDADAVLRNEFLGDFEAYLAYEKNKSRAKVYNR